MRTRPSRITSRSILRTALRLGSWTSSLLQNVPCTPSASPAGLARGLPRSPTPLLSSQHTSSSIQNKARWLISCMPVHGSRGFASCQLQHTPSHTPSHDHAILCATLSITSSLLLSCPPLPGFQDLSSLGATLLFRKLKEKQALAQMDRSLQQIWNEKYASGPNAIGASRCLSSSLLFA